MKSSDREKGRIMAPSENGTSRNRSLSDHDYDHSFAMEYKGPVPGYPLTKAELVAEAAVAVAAPYHGAGIKRPLPKAQVYVPGSDLQGKQKQDSVDLDNKQQTTLDWYSPSPRASSSASPLSEASPMVSVQAEAVGSRVFIPSQASPSEIEELNPASPSIVSPAAGGQISHSFEGNSSGFHVSEEFSAPESGEMAPGARVSTNVGNGMVDGQRRKKGQCYRCFRGNRLTEKEVCLVCGAKYCGNCVLRAMGSMAEGRKCESCVGCPIRESRRPYLGKPSRLLKKLLDPLELQNCMTAERECSGNQLQPSQIVVNGRRLVAEEMAVLATCTKLKPGRYWYDRVSGLWGKEGEKPEAVITPELKVGGHLQPNASGDTGTKAYINGREVTKSELKFLKMFGVQCTSNTYLYLNGDGGYGEEGQRELGNLWNRPTAKLLYPFFSFPVPRANGHETMLASNSARLATSYVEVPPAEKLLLLGHEGSGRSTIFKQIKLHQNGQFSAEEVEIYKAMILERVFQFLYVLLEARERFEEEDLRNEEPSTSQDSGQTSDAASKAWTSIYTLNERLRNAANSFVEAMAKGSLEKTTLLNTQYSLGRIWDDPSIKETYRRKEELLMLPDVDEELINRVLKAIDYTPSEQDIILTEGLEQGTGLAEIELTLLDKDSDSGDQESDTCRFQLISIGGLATNEFRKWLCMFEDVQVLIFCAAISDYDQFWTGGSGTVHNKLMLTRDIFAKVVNYPCFQETPLVLLLNKYDKFEEKVARGIPLTKCEWFSDYSPVGSSHANQVQQAYMYVVHKFKRMLNGRRIYTLQLNARDRNMVSAALGYIQQVLKCEDDKKAGLWAVREESMYDGDTTSFAVLNHR